MKILIRQIREAVVEIDYDSYSPEDRTPERIMAIEKESAEEIPEYFDMIDASEIITIEHVE